ncbi:MAG: UDP-N-acetylmuramoyl-L-alanine--D-glutamate ligase [Azovibrio sp.]|uniref:UDP-N-acetylmuramoyl-L-alanine--D-glutamate ligase n=1 Tax=Azovibrio sp. TaxID=1872673 RepID=UPI003C72D377
MEPKGRTFLVIGLGESGLAMARWLDRQGARVRVADSRLDPPKRQDLAAAVPDAKLLTGPFRAESFAGIDAIALSPGVPKTTPEIAAATVPVLSEVELFVAGLARYQPDARLLAITGSNGKTTTTALTAHLLNGAGVPAVACGNISPALLDALMAALDEGKLPAAWVLELSSFQLETTYHLDADAAAMLNLSEDHLDRYHGLADYAAAKARIFQGRPVRVLNRDDDWSLSLGGCGAGLVTFGLNPPPRPGHYGLKDNALYLGEKRLLGLDELPIAGLHNAANAMAALALCAAIGVEAERVLPALKTFKGLAHRVTPVAEIGGVRYVDDSKGTNVGATLAALAGMGRPVAIILGGEGKGQDFSPLEPALERHGRAVALIGRDAPAIESAIAACGLPMQRFADMEGAVTWLAAQARPGDCVLLSPACASLDMYRNYAHRAEAFVAAVRKLEGWA